jgi:hypothetical protein
MCFCVLCDLCGEALRAGSTRINCFPFPAISLVLARSRRCSCTPRPSFGLRPPCGTSLSNRVSFQLLRSFPTYHDLGWAKQPFIRAGVLFPVQAQVFECC